MEQQINAYAWNANIDLQMLFIQLAIGFVLGMLLRAHYKVFGSVLGNRDDLAQILPIIVLTIILIITVVKSSIALSLGLVGALSIVRFRTPIKEPEELAYLFIAIAIGLGLGAGQTKPVLISYVIILVAATIIKWSKRNIPNKTIHLSIVYDHDEGHHHEDDIKQINNILSKYTRSIDLRRVDSQGSQTAVDFIIDLTSENHIYELIINLKKYKSMNVTLIDQNNIPSL